jgi:hypothetical protein
MKRVALLIAIIYLTSAPASARYLGSPPGEQTFASVSASCISSSVGNHVSISDSQASRVGDVVAGGGSYRVDAVCEAANGVYYWVVASGVGTSDAINVRSIGMVPGGADNASLVSALNTAENASTASGKPVIFPADPNTATSTIYYFTQPMTMNRDGPIRCENGVSLVFAAGIPAFQFLAPSMTTYPFGYNIPATLENCAVFSIGWQSGLGIPGTQATRGSNVVPSIRWAQNAVISPFLPDTPIYIGDSLVMFPYLNNNWGFGGSITGNVLTVSTVPHSFVTNNGDPGIEVGMLLIEGPNGMPHGLYIAGSGNSSADGTSTTAATCGGSACTGTGGTGTYLLNYSIASPPMGSIEAQAGTVSGGMAAQVQSAHSLNFAPGTIIDTCTTPTGFQCQTGSGTLTLKVNGAVSNAAYGQSNTEWLLPGPHSPNPQNYTVTTSTTGNTYTTPITAGITSNVMTVSSCAGCTLNYGQRVIGVNGGTATATLTGSIVVGQLSGIPVSTCTGISANAFVIGWSSGNPVFSPGTQVASCTGVIGTFGTLVGGSGYTNGTYNGVALTGGSGTGATANITVAGGVVTNVVKVSGGTGYTLNDSLSANASSIGGTVTVAFSIPVATLTSPALAIYSPSSNTNGNTANTISGSNKISGVWTYYLQIPNLWKGMPVTSADGTTIPAGTTLTDWSISPTDSSYVNLTLSGNATATYLTRNFLPGGAIYAAPSSTALTFLYGVAKISGGTGAGTTGTYNLDSAPNLTGGSTLYYYDTPNTIYVTGGPRPIYPQAQIWSDAFDLSTEAFEIYGTSPTRQTVLATFPAKVTHTAGSGSMWLLPEGVYRPAAGKMTKNSIVNFPIGLNMACAQNEVPTTGCGKSIDIENSFTWGILGRYVKGNNSGGGVSIDNIYNHNANCDICEFGGVGEAYIGEMLQSQDESSATQTLLSGCNTNGSTFIGLYASGSGWQATCTGAYQLSWYSAAIPYNTSYNYSWIGTIWNDIPYDVLRIPNTNVNCAGSPTSNFLVRNGIVLRC